MKHFVSNLSLGRKFGLIGAVALAMVAFPTVLAVKVEIAALQAARAEATGIAPSGDVLELIRLTQQHRGLSARTLGGNEGSRAPLQARRAEVERALATVRQSIAGVHDGVALVQRVESLQRRWHAAPETRRRSRRWRSSPTSRRVA